jgi:hypothetical protein
MRLFIATLLFLSIADFACATESVRIPQPEKIVAIGDLHGDAHALVTILSGMNLIDARTNWTGGKTVLIILGDMVDRGNESRRIFDILMSLQQQAPRSGGRVVALLGNHEYLVAQNDLRFFTHQDAQNYRDFATSPQSYDRDVIFNAFSYQSKYGQWLASLPALFIAGNSIFVHGGIDSWIEHHSIEEVNADIQNAIKYYEGGSNEDPDLINPWVFGDESPLRTRRVVYGLVSKWQLTRWLHLAGVRRLVVGHTTTSSYMPILFTKEYDDKLIMMDTGNSAAVGGTISALEIDAKGRAQAYIFQRPHYESTYFTRDMAIDNYWE